MIAWLTANWGTLIVLLVLAVIVGLILARLIKNKKEGKCFCQYANGGTCSGNCANCHGGTAGKTEKTKNC